MDLRSNRAPVTHPVNYRIDATMSMIGNSILGG
jgi:hypothetical protein